MRNIIFFLILFNTITTSQTLTGYYPLETGNVWEYWDPWDSIFIFKDTIIGDSLAYNGNMYKIRETKYWDNSIFFSLLRFADNTLYGYSSDSDQVIYDFTKTQDDTLWVIYLPNDTIVYSITLDYYNFFYGKLLRHTDYYYESTTTSYYNINKVVDSIGLIYIDFEPGIQYFLRGAIINGVQYGIITNVQEEFTPTNNFYLYQNYPNPFNSSTQIEYTIPERKHITIKVFDVLGKYIRTLINEEKDAGQYKVNFNAAGLAGGVYFFILKSDSFYEAKKMIFLP